MTLQGKCPHCGEVTKEATNTWAYGSPIRFCLRCKQEYLDQRWREVAVVGFDPRSTSPAFYLKAFLITLALAAASGGWSYYTINFKHYYYTSIVVTCVICAIASVAFLGLAIWIGLGFAAKKNDWYLQESKRRLQNPEYVKKLISYGYRVPEEYLQGITDGEQSEEKD